MARPLYSTLFYEGHPAAGTPTTCVAPAAGFVAVVRDITAYNAINLWTPLRGFAFQTDGLEYVWNRQNNLLGQRSYQWQGREIVEPGHTLTVTGFEASWYFRVNGYLLTLP
jgi:hypothetical protein